ncbi:hypothetical protein CEP52_009299 [Fusarium oligoseptatum]|uniref:Acyltransferase n=1 Tax=Fusarium oligoseptatum TaxID=2604345 RepID=A0A428TDQ6_9HYPO|nr:hypothetical protein CEP52_009299 [Fusarium oligoseptatum]
MPHQSHYCNKLSSIYNMDKPTTKVSTTATHVVHSQHPISLHEPFVLGPFDHLSHFSTPVNAVWFYESSSTTLVPLERLKKVISRLLDYYPHLTGRLQIDPDTGTYSVSRLGSGMHLVEAHCDASFRSFASLSSSTSGREFDIFDFPRHGNALLAPWDLSIEGAQRDPVFTIQRTEFACSAVAIGMRLSHVVGGAGTFLSLYQDLAEIYRAIDNSNGPIELRSPPHLPPFMVSQMLHMDIDEKEKALNQRPAAYSLYDAKSAPEGPAEGEAQHHLKLNKDLLVGRSLRFSSSAIGILKHQAANPDDDSFRVSSFTALTAHLWQHIHHARLANAKSHLQDDLSVYAKSMYGTSVNFIPHFGLPKRSLGNTVVTPVVELDSTELEQANLWEINKIINGLVRHVSEEETRQLGSWVAAQPKKSDIRLNFKVTPTTLITTGWHVFPLYSGSELEVSPAFASPVFMESLFDGIVFFVEPKARDGSLGAIAALKASTWELLDADEGFITTWDRG